MSRLIGIRAVIVGGASGIGRAVAARFFAEAATVGVLDKAAERLRGVADVAAFAAADATDPQAIEAAVDQLVTELGGLDVLVHTVGVHDAFFQDLGAVSSEVLANAAEEIFAANVTSALLALRAALPTLQRSAKASVTLTASESAFGTVGGGPLYGASKWAIRGLVGHLASVLAPRVRVNGVAPGGTTGTRLGGARALGSALVGERPGRDEVIKARTRLGVLIHPEDLASAYVYLAAPAEARAVTGTIINVDGGRDST